MTELCELQEEPTWGESGGQATDVIRLEIASLSLAILSTKKFKNAVQSLTFSSSVQVNVDLSE